MQRAYLMGIVEQIPTISAARIDRELVREAPLNDRAVCPLERLDDAGNAQTGRVFVRAGPLKAAARARPRG